MVVTNDVLLRRLVSHGVLENLYLDTCFLKPLGVPLQPFVPPMPTRKMAHQGIGPLIPMTVTLGAAPHYLCASIQIYSFLYD